MFQPYRLLEETEEHEVYEFRPEALYALHLFLLIGVIGVVTGLLFFSVIGAALIIAYFFTVSVPSMPVHQKITTATRARIAERSGSRWSFKDPMRVKIPKRGG